MTEAQSCILSLNGGSSSIKFSFYRISKGLTPILFGEIENAGEGHAEFNYTHASTGIKTKEQIDHTGDESPVDYLIDWLEKQDIFKSVKAIGHRIVFGMDHTEPQLITDRLLDEFAQWVTYDPSHMPGSIALIKKLISKYPELPQIACFDTSFHAPMPAMANIIPIPRRFYKMGIRRYGFHGLSYHYLTDELARISGQAPANSRVIIAHLGNGASLAAIKDGHSIDTSMGFTPAGGITMSTRSGDIDPGIAEYLMQREKLTPRDFFQLMNNESGMLGISETSGDMRTLQQSANTDHRSAEAIGVFCYQVKKCIGSFAAALGGLDTLIFSGGIGENAVDVRTMICKGLGFLGIELDDKKNTNNEPVISGETSRVIVRMMRTDEQWMIAKLTCSVMKYSI